MKVLIDAMLPWRLANLFREHGHEARHVRRLAAVAKDDRDIWKLAGSNGEIVITCDSDFKAIQSAAETGKLICYHHNNATRAQIVEDFEQEMLRIEAFAASDAMTLEIIRVRR